MTQMPPMPPSAPWYQPPQAPIWRWGDQLLMHEHAVLPNRCVKCNAEADGRLRRRLTWHNPLLYLVILAGLIVYFIVAVCVQETVRIDIGLCQRHRARRYMAITIGWVSVIVGTALFILAGAWENGLLVIPGILIFFGGAIYGVQASRMVWPARIDRGYVWLKGVDGGYLEMFPAAQAMAYVNPPADPEYAQGPQSAAYGQPIYAPGVTPQRAIPMEPPPLPPGRIT